MMHMQRSCLTSSALSSESSSCFDLGCFCFLLVEGPASEPVWTSQHAKLARNSRKALARTCYATLDLPWLAWRPALPFPRRRRPQIHLLLPPHRSHLPSPLHRRLPARSKGIKWTRSPTGGCETEGASLAAWRLSLREKVYHKLLVVLRVVWFGKRLRLY